MNSNNSFLIKLLNQEHIYQGKTIYITMLLIFQACIAVSSFSSLTQMEIQECPTLRPSWKEFRHFYSFVQKVQKQYKENYGMVKVVPPPEWKYKFNDYQDKLKNLMVNQPIEQNIFGKGGIYQCLHIQKKSMSLNQYKQKITVFDRITSGRVTKQIESMFWKNIVFSPPLYGADLVNTLMDEKYGQWNLNNLDSLLKYSISNHIKGVTTSYCYVGSWKTLFCWHKEDLDLSAINFLHQGKSKFWYSIPANQDYLLEREAKKLFPEHFGKCNQHLRHKTTLINPYLLKRKIPELKLSKVEHKPGEFMLVFGGSYHCGFNIGFNIAEAINYATLDWLNRLPHVKYCTCSRHSVKVSNVGIMNNLQGTKIAQTPEYKKFKATVQKEIEDEQEENLKKESNVLKSQLSKKIKKQKKIPKSLQLKGEKYLINNWVLCDKCGIWRKTKEQHLQKNKFYCKQVGKQCNKQQKVNSKNMILL